LGRQLRLNQHDIGRNFDVLPWIARGFRFLGNVDWLADKRLAAGDAAAGWDGESVFSSKHRTGVGVVSEEQLASVHGDGDAVG